MAASAVEVEMTSCCLFLVSTYCSTSIFRRLAAISSANIEFLLAAEAAFVRGAILQLVNPRHER